MLIIVKPVSFFFDPAIFIVIKPQSVQSIIIPASFRGVIEKYKSEAQYNLLNWQKCSNEMIELYNKYQKLADEYKELKERMECKEKL